MTVRMRRLLPFRARSKDVPAQGLKEGAALYAVGDIHGREDLLARVHNAIDRDARAAGSGATEIYLGDYIDRGPNSAGVLQRLLDRAGGGHTTVFLRGNHEALCLGFLRGEARLGQLVPLGFLSTLGSYGIAISGSGDDSEEVRKALAAAMPSSHLKFLEETRLYFQAGPYLFAHAGIRPRVPLQDQTEQDLLWIRNDFLDYRGDFGVRVVHGHTPCPSPEFRPNRINIDTGAYVTNKLTCLKITSKGPELLAIEP